jgi:hypothetical protein
MITYCVSFCKLEYKRCILTQVPLSKKYFLSRIYVRKGAALTSHNFVFSNISAVRQTAQDALAVIELT